MKKILALIFCILLLLIRGYGQAPFSILADHSSDLATPLSPSSQMLARHAPMSGTYTIGGRDGNFTSFTQAVQALEMRGASDSVIFKVRPGNYQEQVYINQSYPQVTFEGDSNDSTKVVLENNGDHVVLIEGARNYVFRRMTISGSGSAVKIMTAEHGTANIILESNILKGGRGHAVIHAFAKGRGTRNYDHIYRNNLIIGEGTGINKARDTHEDSRDQGRDTDNNLEISGNLIQVKGIGIYLYAQESVKINNNQIRVETAADHSFTKGIELSFVFLLNELNENEIRVEGTQAEGLSILGAHLPEIMMRNRLHLPDGGTGILFGRDFAFWTMPSLVVDNMVSVKGNRGSVGLLINNPRGRPTFYHNSILVYGQDSGSKVLSLLQDHSSYKVELLNNIFANTAGGKVIYVENNNNQEVVSVEQSDYNVLYSTGNTLANWGNQNLANLNQWQILTGFDAHSIFVDPQFKSQERLIPTNPALDGAGIYLAEVPSDYFGQIRNTPPDIGAVEFEPESDKPEPTLGFVVGGAVFHSPAGAITHSPFAEGRAILSFHANQNKEEERPKGVASLTIPQANLRFQSNNAYEWMAVEDHKALMEGTGALNREAGYRFVLSVVDWGTGSRDPKDSYRMIIWNPEGEVVYDNQPGLETYASATMPIERGNILVRQEAGTTARMSAAPPSTGIITKFRAYPTKLGGHELWLEIPAHELLVEREYRFSIIDRQGRVMTESHLSSSGKHQLKLNSEQWIPGIYLLIIRGEGIHYQQKLMK